MEMKSKKTRKYAVIAAVILIPLIYSFFYLYAFWDPYSKLQKLPVAVVNEDMGGVINGEERNIGREIVDNLKNDTNLKWVFTDEEDAKQGLQNRKYYAEINFPKDFSSNISSVDKEKKIEGMIVYRVNEKRNYLASQVLNRVILEVRDNISRDITKEIVSNMVVEIRQVPEDLKTLNNGLNEMYDGSKTLYVKMRDLNQGQIAFGNGIDSLYKGVLDAKNGAASLENGSSKLADGAEEFYNRLSEGSDQVGQFSAGSARFKSSIGELNSALAQLPKGTESLKEGSGNLNKGLISYTDKMKEFNTGLNEYTSGVQKSADANKKAADYFSLYLKNHPEAMKDPNIQGMISIMQVVGAGSDKLKTSTDTLKTSSSMLLEGAKGLEAGSKQLNDGINTLNDNTAKLTAGSKQLSDGYSMIDGGIQKLADSMKTAKEGAGVLAAGTNELNTGVGSLKRGMDKIASGAGELKSNSDKIVDGEGKLYDGISKLNEGIKEANDKVSSAVKSADDRLAVLDGIDKYASEPVILSENRVNPIPDYGTAFSPYFISLSLWVGALIMFYVLYLDPEERFKRFNSTKLSRIISYALIGIVQSIILGMVIRWGLHLDVKNIPLYYAICIIISLSFTSIMEFLIVNLGEVGKFIAIVLLILQLTACGGTFPMELVPGFFNKISWAMPMTYSVNLLKEVISGLDYKFLSGNLAVLGGIAIAFFCLSALISKISENKNTSMKNDNQNRNGLTA